MSSRSLLSGRFHGYAAASLMVTRPVTSTKEKLNENSDGYSLDNSDNRHSFHCEDKSETFTSWQVYRAVFAVCYTRPGLTPSPHTVTNITLDAGTFGLPLLYFSVFHVISRREKMPTQV